MKECQEMECSMKGTGEKQITEIFLGQNVLALPNLEDVRHEDLQNDVQIIQVTTTKAQLKEEDGR